MTLDQLMAAHATLGHATAISYATAIAAFLAAFVLGAALLVACGARRWLDQLHAAAQVAIVTGVLFAPGVIAAIEAHDAVYADRVGDIALTQTEICDRAVGRVLTEADSDQVALFIDSCGTKRLLTEAIAANAEASADAGRVARILALAEQRY